MRMRATPVQDKWAWITGLAAAGLGLAAHMAAGGSAPAIPVLLAFAALCSLAAELIARWIHGPLLLLFLSGAAQQLLHLGFSTLGGYFAGSGLADHAHTAGQALSGLPAATATSGGSVHLMLYTHMAAAILTLLVGAGVSRMLRARSQRRVGISKQPSGAHG